jgi:hypothetical protein
LNSKSEYYPNAFRNNLYGYRIWNTHRLIRNSSKKIMKKIKKWNKLYANKVLNKRDFTLSSNLWLGHIRYSNSYNLKNKMIKKHQIHQ